MKKFPGAAILLLAFSLSAQTPTAAPLKGEPHHHLVFENDYVRVFRVGVPAHAATLLHQHDVPYIYVSLGPADVVNAVQGRPEARIVMTDGQVGYSLGHFAHIARTDAGSTFDNVTIELLKPQGDPRNLCEKIINGPLNCTPPDPAEAGASMFNTKRLLETGELSASQGTLAAKSRNAKIRYAQPASKFPQLLVADDSAELRVQVSRESSKTLHGGEVLWIAAGKSSTISSISAKGPSRFLQILFKD